MKKIVFCLLCSTLLMNADKVKSYETSSSNSNISSDSSFENTFLLNADSSDNENEGDNQDSLTISSAYFGNQYTNKQLAVFVLEVTRGLSRFENFIANKFDENRNVAMWGMRALSMWIYCALNTAYHEIGHGLRARAYGGDFRLSNNKGKRSIPFKKSENFFSFFVKRLGSTSRASCRYRHENNLADEEHIVISAAGMNNEVYLAEKISKDFHNKGRLHFLESFAYFYDRLSPIVYALSKSDKNGIDAIYSSDDPVCVGGYYKKLGISATKNDIALGGLISILLSGTTYSILKYSFTENDYAEPMSFHGFQVPDTFSYVTSKGISYKTGSAYQFDRDLKIIFGVEHVFHGKSATEIHLGFNKTFGKTFYDANLEVITTFGKGFNLEAECSIPVVKCLSINFGGGTYSCKSLIGERHAKNAKNGKRRSNDVFVSVSYKY